VALVLVGVAFAVTAFAYCVMAFRAISPASAGSASTSGTSLMQWLDAYGLWLMLGELVLLAISSFAAMATDRYWTKPNPDQPQEPQ
jgi:hypothetical protein